MPFKFFSIPGVRPLRGSRKGPALPPLDEIAGIEDYVKTRSPTSHGVLGLDPGQKVQLSLHGDIREGVVQREEGDQKSGNASAFIRTEGSNGGETHRVDFGPGDTPRQMVQIGHPKRVKE